LLALAINDVRKALRRVIIFYATHLGAPLADFLICVETRTRKDAESVN
jgi:hypothetical protein